MNEKSDILIVEDSKVFAMGLNLILSSGQNWGSIGMAADPLRAMTFLREHPQTHLVIIDISLTREHDGLTLLSGIKENWPSMRCMILSHYKNPDYIRQALELGAEAYLAKDSAPEEILRAVREVCSGRSFLFGETIPDALRQEILQGREAAGPAAGCRLSPKEKECLQLITCGYSNRQIASAMQIATTTVDTYKERIKDKFGFDTIIECVASAVAAGLVEIR